MCICVCRREACLYKRGTTRVDCETVKYVTDSQTDPYAHK